MALEAALTTRFDGLGNDHPVALEGLAELVADLRSVSGLTLAERALPELEAKGGALELVVSILTPATMVSLTRIIQLWLNRDRRRSLTVSVRNTRTGKVIEVEGNHVTVEALTDALAEIVSADESVRPTHG